MDPITIALATFGVQKLRGKSTRTSLKDAMTMATLGQAGSMAGVPGLQGFGSVGNTLGGTTLGQQFMNTAPVQGIGALFGQTPATTPVNANSLPLFDASEPISGGASVTEALKGGTTGGANQTLFQRLMPTSTAGKVGLAAFSIPLLSQLFGGDDKNVMNLPTPNKAYSKFAKSGLPGSPTGFYTKDYETGQVSPIADKATYQTVEDVLGDEPTQTFKAVEMNTGGLASIAKFSEGGQILPSKFTHDENDANNYQRANGFVMDGTGNGKDHEDTMLAQLADGEFVSRSHAVLGAGIIAGASIKDKKDQRKKGAEFFYEQQKRFKRIYDLINANKTEH